MAVKFGETLISKLCLGPAEIKKVYLGSSLIHDTTGGGGVDYDADAEAVFAAFTTPPSDTRKGHINDLVVALKTAGIWTKIDVLYLYAAADAQAALVNWKNPGTYDGTATNAPSFTTDRGFTGNKGGGAHIDSNFNAATASTPQYVRNSAFIASRSLTNTISSPDALWGVSSDFGFLMGLFEGSNFRVRFNATGTQIDTAPSGGAGLWAASRGGASDTRVYKNGSQINSGTTDSVNVFNGTIRNLRVNTLYGAMQVASFALGSNLSGTEQADFYDAELAYMQAVGAV